MVPLLRQQLGLGTEFTGLRAPPEMDEERHDTARPAVDVVLFPKWFTVEDGGVNAASSAPPGETWRRMVEFSHLTITGDRMRFSDDGGKKHEVNPIRFVAACPKGHLEDIEWRWLVHRSGDRTCKRPMFWVERGVSSDPSDISVRCSCGLRVTMADLYKPKFLGTCHANSPWLRPAREATDVCAEDLRLLPRSATNTYFSQTITVISLTASNDRLLQVGDGNAGLVLLQNTDDLLFGEPGSFHLWSPLGQSLLQTGLCAGGNVRPMVSEDHLRRVLRAVRSA